jgi:acyl carrier protein
LRGIDLDIKSNIIGYVEKTFLFGLSDKSLHDNDSFLDKGIVDSTGILEIVSYIEEEFDIEVQDEELVPDNFDSINKLTDYITKKIDS